MASLGARRDISPTIERRRSVQQRPRYFGQHSLRSDACANLDEARPPGRRRWGSRRMCGARVHLGGQLWESSEGRGEVRRAANVSGLASRTHHCRRFTTGLQAHRPTLARRIPGSPGNRQGPGPTATFGLEGSCGASRIDGMACGARRSAWRTGEASLVRNAVEKCSHVDSFETSHVVAKILLPEARSAEDAARAGLTGHRFGRTSGAPQPLDTKSGCVVLDSAGGTDFRPKSSSWRPILAKFPATLSGLRAHFSEPPLGGPRQSWPARRAQCDGLSRHTAVSTHGATYITLLFRRSGTTPVRTLGM